MEERSRNPNNSQESVAKISIDTLLKISQLLIIPLLLAMFYLLTQINGIEKRFISIEAQMNAMPKLDVIIAKIAVMEDRQNANIRRIEFVEAEFTKHREFSTYDSPGAVMRRIPRQ